MRDLVVSREAIASKNTLCSVQYAEFVKTDNENNKCKLEKEDDEAKTLGVGTSSLGNKKL